MISAEDVEEDMQYIRDICGPFCTVLTLKKSTLLYSITVSSTVSHSSLVEDMPFTVVCGIHSMYSTYVDLAESVNCNHLVYSTKSIVNVLDVRDASLICSSRLYRSLLYRTDLIHGVLCRSWSEGPLEIVLYNSTESLLDCIDCAQQDYSQYESLEEWSDQHRSEESSILKAIVSNSTTIAL